MSEDKRGPFHEWDDQKVIVDVEGQEKLEFYTNATDPEEIAEIAAEIRADEAAYEEYKKTLTHDESKTLFSTELIFAAGYDHSADGVKVTRIAGVFLCFSEYNHTMEDSYKYVETVQLEDTTHIFENGDDALLLNEYPDYSWADADLRRQVKCSALAVLCASEVLKAVLLPRLNASKLTIKERRSFLRGTAERFLPALTRETKDHEKRCLRGQRGAHGSDSFRANVKAFAQRELDRLAKREFRYVPIARKAMTEYRESVIIRNTAPRKLKKVFAADLIGQTPAQKEDFIARIQREARDSVFSQDDGNGIAMLAQILLDERLARVRQYNAQEAAKRARQRMSQKAAAKEKAQAEITPVVKFSELDIADILKHPKELESGYLPRGPKGRAFAIYADTVLKEQNRPYEGRDGDYHRIQSEKALAKMAVYKNPNEREAIPLFAFKIIYEDENGAPLARPVWVMWAASDWIFFPHPIDSEKLIEGGYQKDVLIPAMFAKVYSLALTRGLELSTAGALNKTALFIATTLQTEIDGAAARLKDYGDAQKEPIAEGEISDLPLPAFRNTRKEYLEIVREALAVAGITFEHTARSWKAHKIESQITDGGKTEILTDEKEPKEAADR